MNHDLRMEVSVERVGVAAISGCQPRTEQFLIGIHGVLSVYVRVKPSSGFDFTLKATPDPAMCTGTTSPSRTRHSSSATSTPR